MAETIVAPTVEKKMRKVFRNASQARIYYLRSRDAEKPEENFRFLPGMTLEALDEAEEKLLGTFGDIRDVGLETPALTNSMDDLHKKLAAEKEENAKLRARQVELEGALAAKGSRKKS